MKKKLILDEWLWADLSGGNGESQQDEGLTLLRAIYSKCDRIITVRDSAFEFKFLILMKESGSDQRKRAVVRCFKDLFFFNSEKLERLDAKALPTFPANLETAVKDDDKYLVLAYLASKADVLVTTDNPLMAVLKDHSFVCLERAVFLSTYDQP